MLMKFPFYRISILSRTDNISIFAIKPWFSQGLQFSDLGDLGQNLKLILVLILVQADPKGVFKKIILVLILVQADPRGFLQK